MNAPTPSSSSSHRRQIELVAYLVDIELREKRRETTQHNRKGFYSGEYFVILFWALTIFGVVGYAIFAVVKAKLGPSALEAIIFNHDSRAE